MNEASGRACGCYRPGTCLCCCHVCTPPPPSAPGTECTIYCAAPCCWSPLGTQNTQESRNDPSGVKNNFHPQCGWALTLAAWGVQEVWTVLGFTPLALVLRHRAKRLFRLPLSPLGREPLHLNNTRWKVSYKLHTGYQGIDTTAAEIIYKLFHWCNVSECSCLISSSTNNGPCIKWI